PRTLTRARGKLRVQSEREGFGKGGTWYLSLPSEQSERSVQLEGLSETQIADRQWSDTILNADWGEEALCAPDFVRLAARGDAVTEAMPAREAARLVRAQLNGH